MKERKMTLEKRMEEIRRMVEDGKHVITDLKGNVYVVKELVDIKSTLSNRLIVLVVCDNGIHYVIKGSNEVYVLSVNRKESIKRYNDLVDKLICVELITGYIC